MTIEKQFEHLNPTYNANKLRVSIGGKSIIVARMGDNGLVLTDEGRSALEANPAAAPTPAKRTRTAKATTVESVDVSLELDIPTE